MTIAPPAPAPFDEPADTKRRRAKAWDRRPPVPDHDQMSADPIVVHLLGAGSSGRSHVSWPANERAYWYARDQLFGLIDQHAELGLPGTTPWAINSALRTLRSVLAEDSVYPAMTIDEDGGIAAQWLASGFVIELDFGPDGETTWSWRQRGMPYNPRTGVAELRQLLREFSAFVAESNPSWRSTFPDVHHRHA